MTKIIDPNPYGPATEQMVSAFEARLGIQLPADYREFLLKHNGGVPEPNTFNCKAPGGGGVIQFFTSLAAPQKDRSIERYLEHLPAGYLPIARDWFGNLVCLGVKPRLLSRSYGKVFLWIHDVAEGERDMFRLSPNFQSFLEALQPPAPEERSPDTELAWHCKDGNLDAVKAYIEAGGDIEARSKYNWTPIQLAVTRDHLQLVRYLADHGAALPGTLVFAKTIPMLEFLLSRGVDINEVFVNPNDELKREETPLLNAILYGRLDCLEYLLQRGAEIPRECWMQSGDRAERVLPLLRKYAEPPADL